MKTAGQVAQKLKQVRYRRGAKELKRLTKRAGRNCTNQSVVKTPSGPLGVCKLDCETCDPMVKDRAPDCEDFRLKHSGEELKESLALFFDTRAPNEISVRFPDVAALLWVLNEGEIGPLMEGVPVLQIGGIDVWTDSEEQAEGLKEWFLEKAMESVVIEQLRDFLRQPVEGLVGYVTKVKEDLASEKAKSEALATEMVALRNQVNALETTERLTLWKRMFG